MVACWHLDGCDYFCGGYAARSHRPGLHARRRRQLAVVGVLAIRHDDSFFVCAAVAALRGLWGVLWTDLFQFALKMAIVIGVAWYAVSACGGMAALLSRLGEMRAASPGAGDATSFFPDFSRPISAEALWVLPVVTFLVNIGVQ